MNVGIDYGRGNVKVVSNNTREKFKSYCGEAYTLDFSYGKEEYIVTINDKEYFIGTLAEKEGMSRGFQKQKIDKESTIPLVATGVFLASDKSRVSVNLVTGTPISDYRKQQEKVKEYIKGSYKVNIKGYGEKEMKIKEIYVVPEGAGAYFSQVLNNEGKEENKELSKSKVGIIDIGFKTVNLAMFENLGFVDKESVTLNHGIHEAINSIYKRLSRDTDITLVEAEKITTGPEYERLAKKIKNGVNKFWGNKPYKMFLCGGGAHLLSKYFTDVEVIRNPEYANAEGYFKIAQMIYNSKKTGLSSTK
ncbi:MAG: ParM/StbA family protein [Firmicutes bacterium]|nr:ParM/StbA family protein [Bacillota bacterium]